MDISAKNKGKRKRLLGLAVVLLTVLIAAGGWLVFRTLQSTPAARLSRALGNLTKGGIHRMMQDQSVYQDVDLDIALYGVGMPEGAFRMTRYSCEAEDKEKVEMSLGSDEEEALHLLFAMDEENFYLEIPELSEDTYMAPVEGFVSEFNGSVWAELLKTQLPADLEERLGRKGTEVSREYLKQLADDLQALAKAAEIEDTDTEDGIRVVLPEREADNLLEHYQEAYLSEPVCRLDSDIELVFCLDQKGHMIRLETLEPLCLDTEQGELDVSFVLDFTDDREECFLLELDELTLVRSKVPILKVEGTCEMGLWEQELEMPQGAVDFLDMDRLEVAALFLEIVQNVKELAGE